MEKLLPRNNRSTATVEELLALSAPLAWELAPRLCRRDPVTGDDCSWVHGIWQYLRIMELVGSIEHRGDFFCRALQSVTGAGNEPPRVLLSGAADYATLAHVLAAFRERELEPDITVVDLCETPLMLNRWYAERASCKIETCCCNILDYKTDTAFDVACTDAFLGRFSPAQRPRLFAKWRDLLRPGGLAITVNRLRPASAGGPVGFTPEQAQAFRATVLRTAEAMRESLRIDPHELAQRAEIYANKHYTYPVRSLQEIHELLECSGFRVDQLSAELVAAGTENGVSGPSIREGAEYIRIVARRL